MLNSEADIRRINPPAVLGALSSADDSFGDACLSRPVTLSVGSGPLPLCCVSVVIGPESLWIAQGDRGVRLPTFDNNTHSALTSDLMKGSVNENGKSASLDSVSKRTL